MSAAIQTAAIRQARNGCVLVNGLYYYSEHLLALHGKEVDVRIERTTSGQFVSATALYKDRNGEQHQLITLNPIDASHHAFTFHIKTQDESDARRQTAMAPNLGAVTMRHARRVQPDGSVRINGHIIRHPRLALHVGQLLGFEVSVSVNLLTPDACTQAQPVASNELCIDPEINP